MTHSNRPSKGPDNWEDLIAGYVLGHLDLDEAETLQRILAEQPELTIELQRFQQTDQFLTKTLASQSMPTEVKTSLKANLLLTAKNASIQSKTTQPEVASSKPLLVLDPPPKTIATWRWPLVGSIAALLILALGRDSYRLRQALTQTKQQLSQVQQELLDSQTTLAQFQNATTGIFLLAATAPEALAYGNATFTSDNRSITIIAKGLPPVTDKEIYRLWAVIDGHSEPIFCGQFRPNLEGDVAKSWATPEIIAQAEVLDIMVTRELMEAPHQLQGRQVLRHL